MACLVYFSHRYSWLNVPLLDKIGFGKVLVIVTFAINGIGIILKVTSYVASLENHPYIKMMIPPLVATQFPLLPEEHHHDTGRSGHDGMRQLLGMGTVHMLAAFSLVYVGTEVTKGGIVLTYVLQVRIGGASSSYISSRFFGGLMAGWLVPSLIGGAVAVSLVGFVLGPMYAILMSHTGRVLLRWMLSGSIGWIAGLGQAGNALFPFVTGAVANKAEIKSQQSI
ncbi:MFS general substrate transporter [Desarmillaria ectypa]|nr:MFS general substrate transporter [Desarmillaria ectypa]